MHWHIELGLLRMVIVNPGFTKPLGILEVTTLPHLDTSYPLEGHFSLETSTLQPPSLILARFADSFTSMVLTVSCKDEIELGEAVCIGDLLLAHAIQREVSM